MKGCILTCIFYTFCHKNLLVNLHCSTDVQYGQKENITVGVEDEENKLSSTKPYKTLPMRNNQPGGA
jgi:hypothetical protein